MYYLFIVNDFSLGNEIYTGKEIADKLLDLNLWAFSPHTPKIRYIQPADKVIIYIAGKGNHYFYANFEIVSEIEHHQLIAVDELEKTLFSMFSLSCQIRVQNRWSKPLCIVDIKGALDFITDKKNYGLFLRQSVKEISEKDYALIVERIKYL